MSHGIAPGHTASAGRRGPMRQRRADFLLTLLAILAFTVVAGLLTWWLLSR